MDKRETDIQRGIRAQALMDEPLFAEARDHIDAELYRLFKAAVPTDIDALTQIKSMEYFHAKYLEYFKRCIQDGKIAKLEAERKPRHSATEFGYR